MGIVISNGQYQTLKPPGASRDISLVDDCGIRNIVDLAAGFQRIGCEGPIRVDATGLTSVDVSVLQLLVSAKRMVLASNGEFTIVDRPEGVLRSALERAGLGHEFEASLTLP
ncbi:STAS domain-containing protein [Fulvimarina sp. MAC8]|uniref:STAS domain-containing protein n=1 Tax=Fulvimarina sp. MAC8 TaxID=3162874 RepID=UPI0032EF0AF2